MAIKYNYEIIEDVLFDTYLKINDFSVNSQLETDTEGNEKKSFICSSSISIINLNKTKTISSINEIFIIPDIHNFNLAEAYKIINKKYPGEMI